MLLTILRLTLFWQMRQVIELRLSHFYLRVALFLILFNFRLRNRVWGNISTSHRPLDWFLPHLVDLIPLLDSRLANLGLWVRVITLLIRIQSNYILLVWSLHLVHSYSSIVVNGLLKHINGMLNLFMVFVIAKWRKHDGVKLLRKAKHTRETILLLLCPEVASHVRICAPQRLIKVVWI